MRAVAVIVLLVCTSAAMGNVFNMPPGLTSLEMVTVGNPGNAGELSGEGAGGYGPDRICGAVDYIYNVSRYEVTAGQYAEFLNKVAATDTYGLYDVRMDNDAYPGLLGCNIKRTGSSGSYAYSVPSEWANRPVNYVTYWDACRFANWLHNGQPTGEQGTGTTETGAYALTSAGISDNTVARNDSWKWAVTSEDEWYKAAYYNPATSSYYDYPTSSNSINTDMANYGMCVGHTTDVGSYAHASSYGTFDQAGNVWEWNELARDSGGNLRGASFSYHPDQALCASWRWEGIAACEFSNVGFRVVQVPEPASAMLFVMGGVLVVGRRVRRFGATIVPAVLVGVLLPMASTRANVFDMPPGLTSLEVVTVGNPGNAGELSGEGAGGYGPDRVCGAVSYTYNIGKYEVTAGQYTEFLNAVAKTDAYGLYNPYMWAGADGRNCGIQRSGLSGSYTYSVAPDLANRPVNYVSWGDAARFANWLHNGQPAGPQNTETTEEGAYYVNGAISITDLMAVTRNANATWVIPSEDEWYKAAHHKNDGVTGNYWDYPTGTDSEPSNALIDPDPGNNATFYGGGIGYTIGSPYYRTEVGAHENSESPYGTLDQGGNIREWNETVIGGSDRGTRGGSFMGYAYNNLWAAFRYSMYPTYEDDTFGFRVALVPEPATLLLLALSCLAVMRRR
jgi:formylglycine-generating enzyme required for sulfatase activity